MPREAANLSRGAPDAFPPPTPAVVVGFPPLLVPLGMLPSGSCISLLVMRSKIACSSASGRICVGRGGWD